MNIDCCSCRSAHLNDYGSLYYLMKWISGNEARRAKERRRFLLDKLRPYVKFHARGNKICYNEMSPGCMSCVDGIWSCIFINNICNANRFLCPAEQNQNGIQSYRENPLPDNTCNNRRAG